MFFNRKVLLAVISASVLTACSQTVEQPDELTWVYESSDKKSCEAMSGVKAEVSALKLSDNKVFVEQSKCAQLTEQASIAMCGADAQEILLHQIDAAELETAKELGFIAVETLKTENSDGYQETDCATK